MIEPPEMSSVLRKYWNNLIAYLLLVKYLALRITAQA